MSVGIRSDDLPGFGIRRGITAEPASDDLDQIRRKVGEVTESLVLDFAPLAVGPAEQMGLVHAVFVDA